MAARIFLMLLAVLTIASNLIYIFSSHLIFIIAAVIIANVGRRRFRAVAARAAAP